MFIDNNKVAYQINIFLTYDPIADNIKQMLCVGGSIYMLDMEGCMHTIPDMKVPNDVVRMYATHEHVFVVDCNGMTWMHESHIKSGFVPFVQNARQVMPSIGKMYILYETGELYDNSTGLRIATDIKQITDIILGIYMITNNGELLHLYNGQTTKYLPNPTKIIYSSSLYNTTKTIHNKSSYYIYALSDDKILWAKDINFCHVDSPFMRVMENIVDVEISQNAIFVLDDNSTLYRSDICSDMAGCFQAMFHDVAQIKTIGCEFYALKHDYTLWKSNGSMYYCELVQIAENVGQIANCEIVQTRNVKSARKI
jgi:hypothetical protein